MRRLLLLSLLCCIPLLAQVYPSAIADEEDLLEVSNNFQTTLSAPGINNSTLTIPVADASGLSLSTPGSAAITIDSEHIKICSKSGNTLTACSGGRGFDGSSAASHSSAAAVQGRSIGAHHDLLVDEIIALETELGASLANVAALAVTNTYTDGAKQLFKASGTTAGANIECGTLPSSPAAGDFACDSGASNSFKHYNGATWDAISGAGSADALLDDTANATDDAVRVSVGTSGRETEETPVTIDPSTGDIDTPGSGVFGSGTGSPLNETGITDDVAPGAPASSNEYTRYVDRTTGRWEIHRNGAGSAETYVASVDYGLPAESLEIVFDGGGSALTADSADTDRVWLRIPWACTITDYEVTADQVGSIVIDLWVDTYANWPPTNADTITASAPVTISGDNKAVDSTLTGWTTSLAQGSWIMANIDSAATVEQVTLSIQCNRTL